MKKKLYLIIFVCAVSNLSHAIDENLNNICTAHRNACPLNGLIDLAENPPEPQKVKGTNITFSSEQLSYTHEAVYRAILGDEKGSQVVFDTYHRSNRSKSANSDGSLANTELYTRYPAIPTIVELAKKHRVVMLNEAHHISMHRHFARQLAIALKEVGFTHIAAETFGSVKKLNSTGYPTLESGAYINDPEFAQFIRHSASLGYRFVRYEASSGDREQSQANNLALFLNKNPGARLFVYAGYAHINEIPTSGGRQWMAELLKDMTGIDPLTIDQVYGTAHHKDELTDPVYKAVETQIGNSSSVFKTQDQNWLEPEYYRNGVDLAVFHPREEAINGRTNWLVNDSSRQPYAINIELLPGTRPIALKAFVYSEWIESKHLAIPMDQILLENTSDNPTLYLPPGNYTIRAEGLNMPDIEIKKLINH